MEGEREKRRWNARRRTRWDGCSLLIVLSGWLWDGRGHISMAGLLFDFLRISDYQRSWGRSEVAIVVRVFNLKDASFFDGELSDRQTLDQAVVRILCAGIVELHTRDGLTVHM